ncbi:hypothetical protein N7448_000949 [Penicillium atrosanguineum]|uniref:SnoaL-like domain-containing protein n=1 Tax=Penicillium atrosanguineum TaxID=1132637 RepID=A0A9W9Q418_9EURO|nr:Casein kinase II subunit beta-1 [Penicillium atrosanguineum]KAJ5134029.1 hypothetical protein N7526_005394 [Penicillium atrosanguineum]KAJ5149371.1 hypothetical protein N7448_000949 [Penicillium atrosanguineum]KAJ5304685.1 Casein kinase II subunit beta-1 [Penicillium atrosanguineum]KAJ5324150.1 hypothetical protein N7476_002750 [Penicillium atrosanguineum]
MPPLLSLKEFLMYIAAFNARDYKLQHSFYHDDLKMVIPDPEIGTLFGSTGIMNHYDLVHADAQETVVPMFVIINENRIFLSMEAYFFYTRATDKAVHSHKVKPGDVIRVKVWAVYDMQDGKMACITCNALGDEFLGEVDVDELITISWSRADDDVKICWKDKGAF